MKLGNSRLISALLAAIVLVYPVLAYFGMKWQLPSDLGFVLGAILLLRLVIQESAPQRWRSGVVFLPSIILCVYSTISRSQTVVLYHPVVMSLAFLLSFGVTLLRPPSAVEMIARATATVLSKEEVLYCRRITMIWTLFFLFNAFISLWTVRHGSLEIWALYNGLLAYCAMALLFSIEITYRYWRFRKYVGSATDPFFRKLFPPRD